MLRHLGYVATNYTIDASTARTCRLANATPDRLRELIAANLADLERVFAFNAENDIRLYRMSSQVIPFASHPKNTLDWRDEFAEPLARLKATASAHRLRVSMHPGQYTVLNSPHPAVVAASVAELEAAARLIEAVQDDATGKIILHVGGAYDDRAGSLRRFEEVAKGLSEPVRRRLVIENDDTVYSTGEVLSLSESTGFPVVFDWFHHTIRASDDPDHARLIARCFASWRAGDGVPKVHLSSQAPGGRVGHHAEFVEPAELAAFLEYAPDSPFDLMLEAKKKDLALLRVRDQLAAAAGKG
jgi:UV DNA damage endonuclease